MIFNPRRLVNLLHTVLMDIEKRMYEKKYGVFTLDSRPSSPRSPENKYGNNGIGNGSDGSKVVGSPSFSLRPW